MDYESFDKGIAFNMGLIEGAPKTGYTTDEIKEILSRNDIDPYIIKPKRRHRRTCMNNNRIPVNACEGCNRDILITPAGYHIMPENGVNIRCAHLKDAIDREQCTLVSAHNTSPSAIRAARRKDSQGNGPTGALLWISSGPVEYWAVVR